MHSIHFVFFKKKQLRLSGLVGKIKATAGFQYSNDKACLNAVGAKIRAVAVEPF
jgi:hypothetical protein